MATYAIGDLQGCYQEFKLLLKQIAFDRHRDQLWLAGDLINRGPQSLDVMRWVLDHEDCVVAVLGNHDLHLLAIAYGIKQAKRKDTLTDILEAPERQQIVDYLRHCPLLHQDRDQGFVMVHAGLPPQWNIDQASALAREVEQQLQSDNIEDYLQAMYGDSPNRWSNDLEGPTRWRTITNHLTRMRICTEQGELNLKFKQGLSECPAGYRAWYQHPQRHSRDTTLLFGHWAALQGQSGSNSAIALDSGCVWGGKLTAIRLQDRQFFYQSAL